MKPLLDLVEELLQRPDANELQLKKGFIDVPGEIINLQSIKEFVTKNEQPKHDFYAYYEDGIYKYSGSYQNTAYSFVKVVNGKIVQDEISLHPFLIVKELTTKISLVEWGENKDVSIIFKDKKLPGYKGPASFGILKRVQEKANRLGIPIRKEFIEGEYIRITGDKNLAAQLSDTKESADTVEIELAMSAGDKNYTGTVEGAKILSDGQPLVLIKIKSA